MNHPKPLFHSYNLLTIHNLYKYHCIIELFKVIKLRTPMSIYELMKRSERRENYFISLPPSSLFDYQASNCWNKCRKSNSEIDFTTSIKLIYVVYHYARAKRVSANDHHLCIPLFCDKWYTTYINNKECKN